MLKNWLVCFLYAHQELPVTQNKIKAFHHSVLKTILLHSSKYHFRNSVKAQVPYLTCTGSLEEVPHMYYMEIILRGGAICAEHS